MVSRLIRAAVLLAFTATPALASMRDSIVFRASPSGGDRAACTSADPCSLTTAQRLARAAAPAQRGDIVVELADGRYPLGRPLTFDPRDSGRNGHVIIWRAAPGARPTLDGGVAITGWAKFDSARGIWRAPLPDGRRFRNLYVNDRRAEPARSPDWSKGFALTNQGFRFPDADRDLGKMANPADIELVRQWKWQISRCRVVGARDMDVAVHPDCLRNSRTVDLDLHLENVWEYLHRPGQWYLDRTGTVDGKPALYYIPRAGERLDDNAAFLGAAEQLVVVAGTPMQPVHDITFQGLTFAHAAWFTDQGDVGRVGGYSTIYGGIYLLSESDLANTSKAPPPQDFGFYDPVNLAYLGYMPGHFAVDHAERIRLIGNRFVHLGATAVSMIHGVRASEVVGNVFHDISGSAVRLGGVQAADHRPCGDVPTCDVPVITRANRIANNLIDDTAVEYFDSPALAVDFARDTTITHNEIHNLPYTAIAVGWGWDWLDDGGFLGYKHPTIAARNIVTYNAIQGHQQQLDDGGAIYITGSQPGSVMAGNLVLGPNYATHLHVGGLYLDEGARGWDVTNNAVSGEMYFLQINCGENSNTRGNAVHDNYNDIGAVMNTCWPEHSKAAPPINDNRVEMPQRYFPGKPPEAVRAIAAQAGLEPAYHSLRDDPVLRR